MRVPRGSDHDGAVAYAGRHPGPAIGTVPPPAGAREAPAAARPVGWLLYLAVSALVAAGYYWLPGTGLLPRWLVEVGLYNGLAVASVVAILVGVHRHRPRSRRAWYLIAAGVASFMVGDVILYVQQDVLGRVVFPSIADVFYLASYPFAVAGLLVLLQHRHRGVDRAGLLDALILITGLALVTWGYAIVPRIHAPGVPLIERLVLVGYPIMDLAVLATAIRLVFGPGRRPPAFWLLAVGLTALVLTDTVYGVVELNGDDLTGSPIDVGWMIWYTALGAAALHPSMRALSEPAAAPAARLTTARIVILVGVAMSTPTLLTMQALRGTQIGLPELLIGVVVLLVAVSARIRGLAREVAAQAAGRQLLLDRAVRAGEEERIRLAADLHDGPIQRLTSLGYIVELARRRLARGQRASTDEALGDLEHRLGGEITALRQLMAELRPPVLDEYGLPTALRQYARAFQIRTAVRCNIDVALTVRLDVPQETVLYRVAQEALANVAKHAKADNVWLRLVGEGQGARLEVRDDGVGFDVDDAVKFLVDHHYGLPSMRARVEMAGGAWMLRSKPGEGTLIVAVLPATPAPSPAPPAAGQARRYGP